MRRKLISAFVIMLSAFGARAQVALGKSTITNNSVSLEFGSGFRGVVLPYIPDASKMVSSVSGTIYLDAATGLVNYVKDQGAVQLFSASGMGNIDGVVKQLSAPVNTSIQSPLQESSTAKVVIGSDKSLDGVLVLSDTDKAMILPKMDSPHLNIINPSPGMIAYDTKMHQVAVFNGSVWTFWKP